MYDGPQQSGLDSLEASAEEVNQHLLQLNFRVFVLVKFFESAFLSSFLDVKEAGVNKVPRIILYISFFKILLVIFHNITNKCQQLLSVCFKLVNGRTYVGK